MTIPSYIATGTYSGGTDGTVTLTPAYPASLVAGDLLLLQVAHQSNATQRVATYTFPGTFTLLFADSGGGSPNDIRQFIYYRISTGSETGTISISVSGGINGAAHRSAIHQFRNTSSSTEGGNVVFTAAGSTSLLDTGVTTLGYDRLALQFAITNGSNTPASFTGESGGDWTLASSSGTASCALWLETAPMASPGTIDGGSAAISSSGWANRGFALLPLGQPTSKRFGLLPGFYGIQGVW